MLACDALAYPFRRENAAVTILGGAFCCLAPAVHSVLPALPYVSILGFIVEGFVASYVALFLQSVMEAAKAGETRAPGWPDEPDLRSIVERAFRVILPVLVSFLPFAAMAVGGPVWAAWNGRALPAWMPWATAVVGLACTAYFPMAMLVYSYYGELAIFHVPAVVGAAARVWRDYLQTLGLIAALLGLDALLAFLLWRASRLLAVPLTCLWLFYALTVSMRAIGLIYFRDRERLGWEPEARPLPDPGRGAAT
jgi:hypothetical protein